MSLIEEIISPMMDYPCSQVILERTRHKVLNGFARDSRLSSLAYLSPDLENIDIGV
jgi:hypothetical protein